MERVCERKRQERKLSLQRRSAGEPTSGAGTSASHGSQAIAGQGREREHHPSPATRACTWGLSASVKRQDAGAGRGAEKAARATRSRGEASRGVKNRGPLVFFSYFFRRHRRSQRPVLAPRPRHTEAHAPCTYISSTPPLADLPHGVSRMVVVTSLLVLALHLIGEAEPVHPSEHLPHARQPHIEHVPCAPG